ncbi:MAG TPA: NrfD/PsrC family molybdoenzyme membrane anchor subunit [Roseiflexaceae bacterium]
MTQGYQRKWETRRGGRSVSDGTRTSYYGSPVIHAPHWKWLIIVYFFLGGISSASYVIACVAELFGGRAGDRIKRTGRYLALATLIPCPWLLIADLGRPERFHHMLRVVKLRSPMSVGTWGLTIYGFFCTLSVLLQAVQDGLLNWVPQARRLAEPLPCTIINAIGGVFGFFVGGYTGVLLGITAVPIWAKNMLLLGPLFLSSAMSNGAAAISLVLALFRGTSHTTLRRLERLDLVALLAELGLLLAARANAGPAIGRPLRQDRLGQIFRWGVLGAGIVAPLALQARNAFGKPSRPLAALASLLTLAGGLCLRYVMVMAGRASAADPQASFQFARKVTR